MSTFCAMRKVRNILYLYYYQTLHFHLSPPSTDHMTMWFCLTPGRVTRRSQLYSSCSFPFTTIAQGNFFCIFYMLSRIRQAQQHTTSYGTQRRAVDSGWGSMSGTQRMAPDGWGVTNGPLQSGLKTQTYFEPLHFSLLLSFFLITYYQITDNK